MADVGSNLLQKLNPLVARFWLPHRKSGHIAAWPPKTSDKSQPYGIGDKGEYDRDCAGPLTDGFDSHRRHDIDQVRSECHEIRGGGFYATRGLGDRFEDYNINNLRLPRCKYVASKSDDESVSVCRFF
jgi:hypothetical protein